MADETTPNTNTKKEGAVKKFKDYMRGNSKTPPDSAPVSAPIPQTAQKTENEPIIDTIITDSPPKFEDVIDVIPVSNSESYKQIAKKTTSSVPSTAEKVTSVGKSFVGGATKVIKKGGSGIYSLAEEAAEKGRYMAALEGGMPAGTVVPSLYKERIAAINSEIEQIKDDKANELGRQKESRATVIADIEIIETEIKKLENKRNEI